MPPKQPTLARPPRRSPADSDAGRQSPHGYRRWPPAPRLASCKRTPPVSSSNTARVGMPLRLSSAASSRAPAIFAPPTSPRLPPWNAPSMAAITTGKPSMLALAITTPSSAWGTTPWRSSQGDMTRANGVEQFAKTAAVEQGPGALAGTEFDEAVLVQQTLAVSHGPISSKPCSRRKRTTRGWHQNHGYRWPMPAATARRTAARTGAASAKHCHSPRWSPGSTRCRDGRAPAKPQITRADTAHQAPGLWGGCPAGNSKDNFSITRLPVRGGRSAGRQRADPPRLPVKRSSPTAVDPIHSGSDGPARLALPPASSTGAGALLHGLQTRHAGAVEHAGVGQGGHDGEQGIQSGVLVRRGRQAGCAWSCGRPRRVTAGKPNCASSRAPRAP